MEESAHQASVNPLALLFLIAMVVLTLKAPRRFAPMGLLVTTCYMPLAQAFVVAGLNFQFFRVLLLVGVIRVLSRGEHTDFVLTPLDKLFIWWGVCGLVLGSCAEFTIEHLINRVGEAFNAFATYFLFRCWVRNLEDVIQTTKVLAVMILPMAASMIVEKFTGKNIFSVFGGVPEYTAIREGKLRCQAAFRHPILAGTYAATLFPLFVGLWFQPRIRRWIPIVGVGAALTATVAASSSGALMAAAAAFVGFGLWWMRCRMRIIRWSLVLTMVGLAIVMKAPIWYLIARVSDITGGTGWHRSYLIDQAIWHFKEWWLVGSTVTVNWAPPYQIIEPGTKNMDITNNYIAEGLGGGLLRLGFFIAMIVCCFRTVGWWTKTPEATMYSRRMFVWAMGVCLLGHSVSFLSVAYFDQIVVMWYWLLAAMSMICLLRWRSWDLMPEETAPDAGLGEPVGAQG